MRLLELRRSALVALFVILALVVRLSLSSVYYGWEESDYGNLAMTRGVLESGFRHFDMNHMPLFYGLSALVMAGLGDAELATHLVALCGGLLTVGGGVVLADRLLGRKAAWLIGAALVIQPELALYSSSALREPIYAAAIVGMLLSLSRERLALASLLAGLAFLTRMDALFTLGPALLVHAAGRSGRPVRLARSLLPLAGAVFLWAWYCSVVHGTWVFWGHSVSVNVETGSAEQSGVAWAMDGLRVVAGLLFGVLPSRVGWLLFVAIGWGFTRIEWLRHGPRRTLGITAICLLGFWLGIAFIAQHDPAHNLYWKWLHGVLPPLLIVAAIGLVDIAQRLRARLPRALVFTLVGLGLLQGAIAMGVETKRQVDLSAELYKPQLELAQWIEANVPEDQPMILDNIPGCYLDRRANSRRLHSWFDVAEQVNNQGDFEAFLQRERIAYVLWFAEDWTQAPKAAPFLKRVEQHRMMALRLTPLQDEQGYGWVFYRVETLDGDPHL